MSPEDVHYRKLNRRLVDQSITLAALALEKEELSKTIDDEAGDDAFELYLAAIATLMHALPSKWLRLAFRMISCLATECDIINTL